MKYMLGLILLLPLLTSCQYFDKNTYTIIINDVPVVCTKIDDHELSDCTAYFIDGESKINKILYPQNVIVNEIE